MAARAPRGDPREADRRGSARDGPDWPRGHYYGCGPYESGTCLRVIYGRATEARALPLSLEKEIAL